MSPKAKVDPFKTRKTKTTTAKTADTLTPPADVAKAIDEFREAQQQMKHFEGEMTVHKDKILEFSTEQFAKRLLNGQGKSFKLEGDEEVVNYVVMDASAGITEDDMASISDRWGDKAAEELVTRDLGSIKFNPDVLEANYDAVIEALQALPEDVLEKLFKPMLMKARPGFAEKAKKFAKTSDDMIELLKALKIKNYIR